MGCGQRTRAVLIAAGCAVGVVLAGCGGDSDGGTRPLANSATTTVPVAVQLFQYQPSPLPAVAGTEVVWTNRDDIAHTVTSGMPGQTDGRFDLALSGKDSTASFTLSEPGSYPYFCTRHESMRGEIVVTAAGSAAALGDGAADTARHDNHQMPR